MNQLTRRQLNRATLQRQLLLERRPLVVTEAVQLVAALQAQEPASPYLALWNRVDGFDPAELDAAFDERHVLKSTMMRITLHAATAEDHPWYRAAMLDSIRAARLNDRRFRATGLTPDDADRLIPHLTAFATEPRTRDELETMLADRLDGSADPAWVLWGLRQCAPLVHAPTGGPWQFGPRPVYVADPNATVRADPDAAVAHLARRYLAAFGPATVPDLAQYTMIRRTRLRPLLDAMDDELVRLEGPDGEPLLDLADGVIPDGDTTTPPRLLGMWDSTLLAYADRSRVIPDAYRSMVIRRNGDTLAAVLVDGLVQGVWRTVDDGIEITAFERFDDETWAALESEAVALRELLADREPAVYRRYQRWWRHLDGAAVRVLAS